MICFTTWATDTVLTLSFITSYLTTVRLGTDVPARHYQPALSSKEFRGSSEETLILATGVSVQQVVSKGRVLNSTPFIILITTIRIIIIIIERERERESEKEGDLNQNMSLSWMKGLLSDFCFEPNHTHSVLKVSSPLLHFFLKTFLLRPENISGNTKGIKSIVALWSNAGGKFL